MPLSLKPGEILRARYKIRERIGQGGAGSIYLADDIRLEGRLCALKEVEYDRSLPENIREEARQQFLREATVLARLDHPNLPKVSDFFSNGPRDYLVMDYVPGEDLRTIMLEASRNKNFIPEEQVLVGRARSAMRLRICTAWTLPSCTAISSRAISRSRPRGDQARGFWPGEDHVSG